jgi:hypothetical protein
MSYTITAQSFPDYDDWGFDDYWGPEDWITWHKKLKGEYGLDQANRLFITAYSNAGTFGAEWSWRTMNTPFRKYARAQGFYDALFSGIGGLIGRGIALGSDLLEGAGEVTSGVGEVAGEIPEALSGIVTTLKIVLMVAIIVAAVWAFYVYLLPKLR